MIDNSTDSIPTTTSDNSELATPLFDERARANARPVQPIAANKTSSWIQRVRSVGEALNNRTRALALVVIAGFSVGAVGGTLLVNRNASNSNESITVAEPSGAAGDSQIPDPASETDATSLDAGISSADQPPQRRYRRVPRPARQQRRAYRVAVIK